MNTKTDIMSTKISFKLKMLHVLRFILGTIGRLFFSIVYMCGGKKIPPITDDILKQPAIEVARRIRNKESTSEEVLTACIRRIKDVNLVLNCFIEDRFELAMKEAWDADEFIRSGSKTEQEIYREKPFLGVPFTTKDSIGVKGLPLTAGVMLKKHVIAQEDAEAIKLLRDRGAIIIGLTNVPELCMWWETHNQIYGRTNNPHNTTRIEECGGSSGGEAAIQAVGGSIFGIGSDIGGSIRMPAFFNGIFGHKPSRNIVSNAGQYPDSESDFIDSFACTGPMTRFAVDLKPLLKIMAGINCNKLNLDSPVDITKLKIFYQYSNDAPFVDNVDTDIKKAMKRVVEYFNVKHRIVAEEKKIGILRKSASIWFGTMTSPTRFGQYVMKDDSVRSICVEIVKNIFGLSGNTFVGLLTSLLDHGKDEVGSEKYNHNLKVRDDLEAFFSEMLGNDGVFLFPTHPTPAPYHNEPLVRPMNFAYTAIINSLGLPSTAIPLGLGREGLPTGLQVVANHNNDRLCLAVSEELEKAFGGWVQPHINTY